MSATFWAVYALVRLGFVAGGGMRLQADDLTRLAQVDALLDGQGWWDLSMRRLGIEGVAMHWTRHVDALFLAVGGGIDSLRPLALVALPLLLALAAFVLVGRIARELGGAPAVPAAMLLLLASVLTHAQFAPGRIDHHGLQIVLVLLGVLGVLRLPSRGWALVTGGAVGVSLSIGLEQVALVGGILLGVLVVARRGLSRRETDAMAVALLAGSVVGSLLFAPPMRLTEVACDVFSLPHLVVVAGVASGLVVAGRVRARVWVLLGAWAVSGVAGLLVAPRCADPYADVAPLLADLWLGNVREAQGVVALLGTRPGFALAVVVPAVVSVGWVLSRSVRDVDDEAWLRVLPALVLGFGAGLIQLRAASAASALGAAVIGTVFARWRDRLDAWPVVSRAGVMAVVAALVSGLIPLVAGSIVDGGPEGDASLVDCAVGLDGGGVEGTVLAPIDLGPHLLARTDARVLAGPYHRNTEGNLLAWTLLGGDPDGDAVRAEGISWVAYCEGMAEVTVLRASFGEGLLTGLIEGDTPPFLRRVPTGAGALRLYRVTDR